MIIKCDSLIEKFFTVKILFKNFSLYLLTTLILTLLIVPITSFSNLIWLNSMNMPVGIKIVYEVLISDLINLGVVLFLILMIPVGISLIISKYTSRFSAISDFARYFVISALTMWLVLIGTVELLYETEVIAGNRTSIGTFLHVIAGGLSGGIFYKLRYKIFE